MPDWAKIAVDYTAGKTLRELEAIHGVKGNTIAQKMKRSGVAKLRRDARQKELDFIKKIAVYAFENERICRICGRKGNMDENRFYTCKPCFSGIKIGLRLRHRISLALKGVISAQEDWLELLGCSLEKAKMHLESQFKEGMTWENHGEWHIDHIRPCASFDLNLKEDRFKCFHYTNLQPLWAKDNLSKGAKYAST